MRSPFAAAPVADVRATVERGWDLGVGELREVLEGAGAHHWEAVARDGRRWFVTCDDLTTKPWLGADRDTVFEHLGAAYRAAHELRCRGVAAVVAPIPATTGEVALRLDADHSVAVCEHVAGAAGRWGASVPPGDVDVLVATLAELHRQTVPAGVVARGLAVPDRGAFDAALAAERWHAGPFAAAARRTLRDHDDVIRSWLAELDDAARRLAQRSPRLVLTHGEPHPGNLIRTAAGLRLVDWDTIAVAPPERDLWMIDDETLRRRYGRLTGIELDDGLLAAHRLLWAVTDLTSYALQLHAPHLGDRDDEWALRAIEAVLTGVEPRPFGGVPR